MHADARGVLAVWHDVAEGFEGEVLDWYDREHHFERLRIPGFLSARRYLSAGASTPLIFNLYETTGPDVLASAPYVERLNNPTPWSARCFPLVKNNTRAVCNVNQRAGGARGGSVASFKFGVSGNLKFDFSAFVARYQSHNGILGFESLLAEQSATNIKTAEKQLRGNNDGVIAGAILVHATTERALDPISGNMQSDLESACAQNVQTGIYNLAFSALAPS